MIYRERRPWTPEQIAAVNAQYAAAAQAPKTWIPPEPELTGLHGHTRDSGYRRAAPTVKPLPPAEPATEPTPDGSDQS